MSDRVAPAAEISATAAIAAVEREGYVVLPSVIELELVTALRERIDELLESLGTPRGTNDFLGHSTRRIFNLLARDVLFERVVEHAAVLPIIEQVLDPECLLSSLTAIEMEAGETPQPLHADDGSIPLPKPHPPLACVALWALSDFDEENGGTRVVPGSHLYDHSPGRDERRNSEARTTEMPAGSVIIYHGSLWHGGGANRSDTRRLGIVANYCAGYIRQEECQLLALPHERVASFSPRLRELVGYGTYHGLHGHVDQRNPAELIDPDAETDMIWRRID